MQPTRPSLAFQLPSLFRRKSLAIAKAQSGVIEWDPSKKPKLTAEDYPPPNAKSFLNRNMPPKAAPKAARIRLMISGLTVIGLGLPMYIVWSQLLGNRNRDEQARQMGLFRGLELDENVAATEVVPQTPSPAT